MNRIQATLEVFQEMRHLRNDKFSINEMEFLLYVLTHAPVPQVELPDKLQVTHPTVSKYIGLFSKRGWNLRKGLNLITISQGVDGNWQKNYLDLTAAGEALKNRLLNKG